MPVGWFELADPAGRSFRAYPALGGAAFADLRLTPVLAVGVATELTANVIPNRADDPQYIVRLIGQVVTVSQETTSMVLMLASLTLIEPDAHKG